MFNFWFFEVFEKITVIIETYYLKYVKINEMS